MSTSTVMAVEAIEEQQDLFLTFHVHGEDYGIAIQHVIEIIGTQKITKVPEMPTCYKGIINLRGRVIPVMDVRLRFGQQEKVHDDRTCFIVVQIDETIVGLIVDQVKEVQEISAEMIESPPKTGRDNNYVRGIGKVADEVKILLDIERLITEENSGEPAKD